MTNSKPQVDLPAGDPTGKQLQITDLIEGDGEQAAAGHQAEVHYVGVSWNSGNEFDASWNRGQTFQFKLGGGQVIAGWDQGVVGMKVGGRRQLTIPPALGYGAAGAGGVIGPNEHLVFVVDLVSVR
ncbi:MAG: peptidylprolyl isomerase [Candidatus Poriferisodalaceae bacterium]|jgi:peptidylprolyl isomerase